MACMESVKVMNREYRALHPQHQQQDNNPSVSSSNDLSLTTMTLNAANLSLKEGEKIRVNVPIKTNSTTHQEVKKKKKSGMWIFFKETTTTSFTFF